MTDRIHDLPSGKVLMPEVIDETYESILTLEETAFFNDTISFINVTVSAKALEAALLIGNFILTNYFNDDPDLAFSKNPDKPVSFNILCEHPELMINRYKLIDMVKVAAQERYFMARDFNYSSLQYTHRLKLTRLPNDDNKIEMVRECISENLTTRQLDYRVKMKIMETEPTDSIMPEPEPAEKAFNVLVTSLDLLTQNAGSLDFEAFDGFVEHLSPANKVLLQDKLMTLIDTMDAAETDCDGFLQKLRTRILEERY